MSDQDMLDSLVPDHLRVRSSSILLESLEVLADIGFHDFEIGTPQRLLVTIEIWLEDLSAPNADDPEGAWDYDFLRNEVRRIVVTRRWNLQETLARCLYERFAALAGVRALRVATAKPDIYADAQGVGIQIASFAERGTESRRL